MQATPVRPNPGQRRALAEMGIDVWVSARPATGQADAPAEPGWLALQAEVSNCRACALAESRTQTVFGVGDVNADWMIIGEAPGAEEDRRGEPFVGRAGQLLNEMLLAVGLTRDRVFIANILKCRPPANRDPRPEEIAACAGHLQRQIEIIQPRLILVVGRIAAQSLLQTTAPVGRLRGKVHEYGPAGLPLVVTYHPAYLLRSPGQKSRSWDDLCLARATVAPVIA
ncbi:MAG: uracil-DNA glycosylase [Chromatiales bacterium]|nr:MAG: uracil-DNA glycosylase [Chromatiales bacterium]